MNEHYCMEHHTVFFMRKNMKNFAHPIEGSDPTKWCNEEAGESTAYEGTKATETHEPPMKDLTRKSIERQTSLKSSVEWCIAQNVLSKDLKVTDVIAAASLFESYLENGVTIKKNEL